MRIGGFQPFSLCDYPGKVAAVVFTQGCDFRCPFCHNSQLIPTEVSEEHLMPEEAVVELLEARRGRIEGVVVSGGEPALQRELPAFLERLKRMGFAAKLDTNGSHPGVLRELLSQGLVDYVAMDVKAPPAKYDRLSGVAVDLSTILESVALISQSGVAHQFRTTVVESLLAPSDLQEIREMLPPNSPYRLQPFRKAAGKSAGR